MFLSYATFTAWQNLPSAVVFVETDHDGKRGIGSGFHIGGGLVVTARHVVEGNKLLRIGRSDMSMKTKLGEGGQVYQSTTYPAFDYAGPFQTFNHPDDRVDIAIIRCTGSIANSPARHLQPSVRLNKHADILTPGEFIMTEVLAMGFPPIPHATAADLVAVRGIISSVILNHFDKRRHFVMSGMARGGFSGGPVFLLGNSPVAVGAAPAAGDHDGTIIGVVTSALTSADDYGNPLPAELGFMAAVSISTVFEAINYHGLDQAGH